MRMKTCFVTIGATAAFNALIRAAVSRPFLSALQANGYTDLLIQYGSEEGEQIFTNFVTTVQEGDPVRCGLSINGFGFNSSGLGQEMRTAKGEAGGIPGVVVSHAGMLLNLAH